MENNMNLDKVLQMKKINFKYPSSDELSLIDIDLEINKGEFVLLCGSSGSGKTTLANTMNGIIPHLSNGDLEGNVIVNGVDTQQVEIHDISKHIGMVFQNPEDQIFSIRVDDEVAFGVECQGYTRKEILKRVEFALDKLRIKDISRFLNASLSGGQKQKVSIASNLAMLPSIIVLDDPTTDLDPISKQEVMDILVELKSEVDSTFIVIEHDLTDLIEYADRIVVMHEGKIVINDSPGKVFYENYKFLDDIGVRIPDHIRLGKYLEHKNLLDQKNEYPIKKDDIKEIIKNNLKSGKLNFPEITSNGYKIDKSNIVAEIKDLSYTYPGTKLQILSDMNLEIYKGEFLGIVGHNGSGKSTFMKNLLGLLVPTKGSVVINEKNTKETDIAELILDIGYVFQNPDNQLFCNTVTEEIQFGLKNRDFPKDVIEKETARVLTIVKLEDRKDDHPFSLSRGQRQRLAVATMLVQNPKIIMLDEPTTGLDENNLSLLLKLMQEIVYEYGGTLIMVTHDMEVVAKYASRVVVINKGEIILRGTPDEIFNEHNSELKALKLKPTIISSLSSDLAEFGMPYIPNWDVFEKQIMNKKEEQTVKL
jgi:energy-coupling factor transport system ATP-binding protein